MITPEERTAGSDDLCRERGKGKECYRQPDDTQIDHKAGDGYRRKRRELCGRPWARVMERDVLP